MEQILYFKLTDKCSCPELIIYRCTAYAHDIFMRNLHKVTQILCLVTLTVIMSLLHVGQTVFWEFPSFYFRFWGKEKKTFTHV